MATAPKKTPMKKTEEKSVLYHKDGIVFVDMYVAPTDEHLTSFTPLVLPKGINVTCSNCGNEITAYSKEFKAYYCVGCLRLYPATSYDVEKSKDKKALQEWTELIRPIVPSKNRKEKPVVTAPVKVLSVKEVEEKKLKFEPMQGLFQ